MPIDTMAGIRQAFGPVALAYFDLHSDLNVPQNMSDGALDWMALGHMQAIPGLVGITLAELNPHNAASNDELLGRFAARFAEGISRSSDGQL